MNKPFKSETDCYMTDRMGDNGSEITEWYSDKDC